jgi:hypothetical protein
VSNRMPPDDQINIALLWLENNEGDGIERDACLAVRDWIRAQQDARTLRDAVRGAGVSVAALRRKLSERAKAEGK